MESYFNPDPKEIEEKLKKRGFFINKYSDDISINNIIALDQVQFSPAKKTAIIEKKDISSSNLAMQEKDKTLSAIKESTAIPESNINNYSFLNKSLNTLNAQTLETTLKKKKNCESSF